MSLKRSYQLCLRHGVQPVGRRSGGSEGRLPTARVRRLGLAAGRRRDGMTVFNVIRDKLLRPDELPPVSPLTSSRYLRSDGSQPWEHRPAGDGPAHRQRAGLSLALGLAA